ncbi:MAG: hypothetical protein ACOYLX_23420, partial [Burkholderiaceae bacterium]
MVQSGTGLTGSGTAGTVIYVSRLMGTANQRVLDAADSNWLLGYHSGMLDRAYYEGWVSTGATATTQPRVYSAVIRGSGLASDLVANGQVVASNTAGTRMPQHLRFNNGYGGESSDAEFGELLAFDRVLTPIERLTVETALAQKWGVSFAAGTVALTGTVFEDVNYGGGAGRDLTTALAAGANRLANARVELYSSAGAFLQATTTDTNGQYAFQVATSTAYTVRVVNGTVSSARAGGSTSGLSPVQTFRTTVSGGTASPVTNRVGGENPDAADATSNTTSATLASLTASGVTPQSIASVTTGSGSLVTGVDFGFNFSTIVNTNDAGQGSLRQFITNANALGGESTLVQAGRTVGIESSIFVLPTTSSGYQSATQHWRISPTSTLPTLSSPLTAIDGLTQSGAAAGDLWGGVTHTLKVELSGGFSGLNVTGNDVTLRGLVIGGSTASAVAVNGSQRFTLRTSYIGSDVTGASANNVSSYCVYVA